MRIIIIILFLATLFSGCSSMNKDECELANWQAMGFQYGARGENALAFLKYQKECAAHKIKADYQAFNKGHKEGLNQYCSFETGNALGTSGSNYNAQCPKSTYPKFAQGFSEGINQYCSYERGLADGEKGANYNATCPSNQFQTFSQGYNDGINRYCNYDRGLDTGNKGSNYNNTCPRVEYTEFSRGYDNGLKLYCSFERGFQIGAEGKGSEPNCAPQTFNDYMQGFIAGQIELDTINKIKQLRTQLVSIDKQIKIEQAAIMRLEAVIISAQSTQEQRRNALTSVRDRQARVSELEHQYIDLENEALYLETQLQNKNGLAIVK